MFEAIGSIDACKIGWCSAYDRGNSAFALMIGICLGIGLAVVVQRIRRWRGKK